MSKRSAPSTQPNDASSKRSKTSATTGSNMPPARTYKRVLVIGLAGHAPGQPAPFAAKMPRGGFRQKLNATISAARESGIELDMMQVKASAFSSALQDIKQRLEANPDGLMIGNGIRGTAQYTIFFEDLVNASRTISPQTRLAFNTSPEDILECCLRNFSEGTTSE